MTKYAKDSGVPIAFGAHPLQQDIDEYFNTTYARSLAESYENKADDLWSVTHWLIMKQEPAWTIIQPTDYISRANSTKEADWKPGLRGAEKGAVNAAFLLPYLASSTGQYAVEYLLRKTIAGTAPQDPRDFYPRILPWVSKELYSLYPNISKAFFEKLAKRRISDAHYYSGSAGGNTTGSGWDPTTVKE